MAHSRWADVGGTSVSARLLVVKKTEEFDEWYAGLSGTE